MKSFSLFVTLLATTVFARVLPKRATAGQNVVYWGQNDSERSLKSYCAPGQGIDIIVLAFISTVGSGKPPTGNFGNECYVNADGSHSCTALKSDIDYCKSQGKKILLSVGGWGANYSINSKADADGIAWSLWNEWAAPSAVDSSASRPIGTSFVDGWDFDIESNPDNSGQYLGELITKLRSYFASDPNHTYYITGAPQCPIPEGNMGQAITSAKFDYLFIQFYNNDGCSAYQQFKNDGGSFNYDSWVSYTANTPSSGAKLFIGIPASAVSASGDSSGAKYYVSPTNLATLVNAYKTHSRFGGVMMWDAGNSDTISSNGCNYAQEARRVLDTGKAC